MLVSLRKRGKSDIGTTTIRRLSYNPLIGGGSYFYLNRKGKNLGTGKNVDLGFLS